MTKKTGTEINKRIAHYRAVAGYSQAEVAEMLGMKLSTYSQRERVSEPTAAFLKKLSVIFGVEIEVLLYGEEKKPNISPKNLFPEPEIEIQKYLTPVLLDKREKEIITMYRSVAKPKKIEIFKSTIDIFRR